MKRLTSLLALFCCLCYAVEAQTDHKDSIKYHFNLAYDKVEAGDITGGTAEYLLTQTLAEADQNTRVLCMIQLGLGKIAAISENNGALQQAVAKGEQYCSACHDTALLARVFLQKGVLQIKMAQLDAAMQSFRSSTDYYLLAKDTLGAMNALAKVGNVLEQQGRYEEANAYYLRYYAAATKDTNSANFLTANIFLTGSYLYLNQLPKALVHNSKVKRLSQQLGAKYEYSQSLRYEADIFSKQGKNSLAFTALNNYLKYFQDTLMTNDRLEEVEQLKAQYETEKKEAQIALQTEQIKEGRFQFWVLLAGLAIALAVGALLFNLTRRLRKRHAEKEFLIKEIHHRVKNNLQILSSLLHMQSRHMTDDNALGAVREGQNRVDAMGLIHQKLYMGDHVAKVEMKDYLEHFGQNMLDSFGIENDRVNMEYQLEPLYLDVDTAIPLGLIINELVTNSLKYAFPADRVGTVTIALWKDDRQRLCLQVSDDGVGQAEAAALKNSTGFGVNLVQILSKKLKGKAEVLRPEAGYATRIAFEHYT